jgi:hypothetical protein
MIRLQCVFVSFVSLMCLMVAPSEAASEIVFTSMPGGVIDPTNFLVTGAPGEYSFAGAFVANLPYRLDSISVAVTQLPGTGTAVTIAPDLPVPGDYDGDGKADVAVYRSGDWWILLPGSVNGYMMVSWGGPGDVPVPADYDGDGKTDVAVYRPSTGTWYVLLSSSGNTSATVTQWGGNIGDVPVPADYDGDRKADVAIYRQSNGTWFLLKSAGAWSVLRWGNIPNPFP